MCEGHVIAQKLHREDVSVLCIKQLTNISFNLWYIINAICIFFSTREKTVQTVQHAHCNVGTLHPGLGLFIFFWKYVYCYTFNQVNRRSWLRIIYHLFGNRQTLSHTQIKPLTTLRFVHTPARTVVMLSIYQSKVNLAMNYERFVWRSRKSNPGVWIVGPVC